MSRSVYGGSDYYRMPTPYGDMLVWCNGRNDDGTHSVGWRTEHDHNRSEYNAPHGGWDEMPSSVTVHRVAYVVHDFARVTDAGEISEFTDSSPLARSEYRAGSHWPSLHSPAVRKYREVISEALVTFLSSEDGRAMFAQGEGRANERRREELDREISETEAKLDALREELRKLSTY